MCQSLGPGGQHRPILRPVLGPVATRGEPLYALSWSRLSPDPESAWHRALLARTVPLRRRALAPREPVPAVADAVVRHRRGRRVLPGAARLRAAGSLLRREDDRRVVVGPRAGRRALRPAPGGARRC